MLHGSLAVALLWILGPGALHGRSPAPGQPSLVTISIVGTSDLHGAAVSRSGVGGLPLLGGYVNNLRAARRADGGAVLLLDSGDTFQGDAESDLSEGAFIVDAYNAMGVAAKAIGNHDFDFGSVDSPAARQLPGDLRGALKARASQARFPFLAANLIDAATGRPVDWPNVRPSVLVDAAGVKVGIVGVLTIDALNSTLDANVRGLRIAPLGPAIIEEATRLRAAGADVVVVAAHAGGRCDRFDDPDDLSSCDAGSEIFRVAASLPHGLVDVIAAGHTHAAIAHRVEGIGIIQAFSRGQAFGRADIVFDRNARSVARVQLFPPRPVCARQDSTTGNCVPTPPSQSRTVKSDPSAAAAQYEGRVVSSDAAIVRAMAPGLDRVHQLQGAALGVSLDAAIRRGGNFDSPLGDVFADAIRAAVPGADAAVLNNSTRGLWADLPAGPVTFGRLYDVFPFDNRIVRVTLTAAELGRWLAGEIGQGRRGALGISGLDMRVGCTADGIHVDLLRGTGEPIDDQARLLVATIAGPTLSGNVVMAARSDAVRPTDDSPVVREVVEDWLKRESLARTRIERTVHEHPADADLQLAGCAVPGALNGGILGRD